MDAQDVQDAVAAGVARYMEWRAKFLQRWMQAVQNGQAAQMFASIPPNVKELMKQADPAQYEALTSALAKKGGPNARSRRV